MTNQKKTRMTLKTLTTKRKEMRMRTKKTRSSSAPINTPRRQF